MPRLDRTGPMGQGPLTGRGLGPCGGGRACGRGFDFRRYISPKNKLSALENEEKILEQELAEIREEKSALKKQAK